MRVKIKGQKWIDGSETPVVIELSAGDKANIAAMAPANTRYCVFPENSDPEEIDNWIAEENPEPAPKSKQSAKK